MQATPTHHRLGHADLLRLSRPTRLAVEEGSLWITLDLEPDDLLVEAGGHYDYDGHTPLIASAIGGPAAVTTQPAEPAKRAAHGWRSWFEPKLHVARLLSAW